MIFDNHRLLMAACYPGMMNDGERQEFQERFRTLVERSPLADADTLVCRAIAASDDPALRSLIEKPLTDFHVDRWSAINAAMKNARDGLVDGRMGAMILSFVHRSDQETDMTVEVTFAKCAAEAPFNEKLFSTFGRQGDDYENWLSKARARARLPERPYQGPARIVPKPKLQGLENIGGIYRRRAEPGDGYKERAEPIHTAKMLSASLVFLRFCQAAERHYLIDTDTPRLPTFLTIQMAMRPMETGTFDYCEHAVRRIPADR